MGAAGGRDRRNRSKPVPVDGYMETCPRCAAKPFERCTKRFGGKTIAAAVLHTERLEVARKALPQNWT